MSHRSQPVAARLCEHDIVVATMKNAAIEPEWQLRKAREAGARIVELETGHSPVPRAEQS